MSNPNSTQPDAPLPAELEKAVSDIRKEFALQQAHLDMFCLQAMAGLWAVRRSCANKREFAEALKRSGWMRSREAVLEELGLSELEKLDLSLPPLDELASLTEQLQCRHGKQWDIAGAWDAAERHPTLRTMVAVAPRFTVRHPEAILHQADLLDRGVISADDIERRFQALQGLPAGPDRDLLTRQLLSETVAAALEEAAAGAVASLRKHPPADFYMPVRIANMLRRFWPRERGPQ